MLKLKTGILVVFLGISFLSFTQTSKNFSISIIDSETKEPIPFSTIHLLHNPNMGWVSNLQGLIQFNDSQLKTLQNDSLVVKSLGYSPMITHFRKIESDDFRICLQAQAFGLNEVIIRPSEDLAIKTILNAIANRKENSPSSINHFSCEKYNKTIMDFLPNRSYFSEIQLEKIQSYQQKRYLLISEKYSTNTFEHGEMVNELLTSYRLSGFKKPLEADFTTQIQPFHFYDPIITLFENTYINPISKSGIANYGYQIRDTIYVEKDTLVAIEYFPKSINKSLLKGILHISLKNYAIAGVTAEPVIQDLVNLKIEQEYINYHDHYLPFKLNYVLSFKKYPSKKYGLKMESYTQIKNYQFNTSQIQTITSQSDSLSMENLRSFKLTAKEQFTYKWIDSIGQVKNFDGKLNFISKVSQAKIPFKIVDIDLSQMQYNLHEEFRIGIGLNSNENLSKRLTVGGYIAYGTRDKKEKYGGWINYKFPKQQIEIEGKYKTDLIERGMTDLFVHPKPDFWRNMMKDSLNSIESIRFSLKKTIKSSSFLIGINKERIQDLNFMLDKSNFTEIHFSAKINFNKNEQNFFQPNNISYKYPILYLNYVKGIKQWEGDFSYSRLALSIDYSFYLEKLGKQSVFASYEKLFGNDNLPYYKLLTGYGANSSSLPFYANKYFQTMHPYQFTHTESFVIHFKNAFLKPLFYTKISEPKISLYQSVGWGRNNQDEAKQFETFDKGYFESGFSIENIIKVNYINFAYIGLGAGVFVTYGNHVSENMADNIVLKINLSVVF